MANSDYDPKTLSHVDHVEVVVIRVESPGEIMRASDVSDFGEAFRCEAEFVKPMVAAWRGLTTGMSARCHIPPFGFRFLSNETLLLSASVCWRCNNLYGSSGSERLFYAFESNGDAALQLLELAKQVTGHEPSSESA
ncbi:MAG: hypothetical protein AAFU85_33200 [Planctomycetota bacterium]